jgi:replication factor A1
VEAREKRESTCKKLTIECRGTTRDNAIFLITADYKVVAQFPIPEYLLRETDPLKEFVPVLEHARHVSVKEKENSRARCLSIKDLKAGMKRISLKAKILEISEPKLALTRFNNYVMLANVILSDNTSTVKLTLWNGRIKMVSVNDIVQIENADVIMFKGELQLRIGRSGRLRVLDKNDLAAPQGLDHGLESFNHEK